AVEVEDVDERFAQGKKLLDVEDVAEFLGVQETTVQRWCREGSLPCMKIGKEWRLRREALDEFLKQSERPVTLVGRMRSFLEVPDNIIGIAQNHELLRRLDSAFFRIGEAQAGLLVKFHDQEVESVDGIRADLERDGLEVGRLEEERRFRFIAEGGPRLGRVDTLRQILEEEADRGRAVWASFDWVEEVDFEKALEQQQGLAELVEGNQLVVKTAVLEGVLDEWPTSGQRQAYTMHSGTIWISDNGLALSRVSPLPPD
ncbi:MAG TPA: helix-turn-helix domain-containing protein, partial [Rubrobacteraceae bacterium]|nr:helix-turn-helix domain-containing protein [Rubrobacteraceae bacterium]